MNYVWALGYNFLAIPLAAGALFPQTKTQPPPWIASIAMAFSSLSVVSSSLMLKMYRRPRKVARLDGEGSGGVDIQVKVE